jgi:predicted DNA-binding transcriptional regulator AlpA
MRDTQLPADGVVTRDGTRANQLDDRRFKTSSVTDRLDCTRETLRLKVRRGEFPPPMKDESGRNYWLSSDLTAYLQKQAEKRAARMQQQQEQAAA